AGGELDPAGKVDPAARAGDRGVARREHRVAEAARARFAPAVAAAVAGVDAAEAGNHRARAADLDERHHAPEGPSVALVLRGERDRHDLRLGRAAVAARAGVDSGAERPLLVGGERRPRGAQRKGCKENAHQRPGRSGRSGLSGRSGRSGRSGLSTFAWRVTRSGRSAFGLRITSPSLKPIAWAISPQPLPAARCDRTSFSEVCSCCGVGLSMPLSWSRALVSESEMFTSP